MPKRRPRKAEQLELPLQAELPLGGAGPGLWEAVAALPAKAERLHRERRKVVKPKLRQAPLLDD